MQVIQQPGLVVYRDAPNSGHWWVDVHDVDPDVLAYLGRHPRADHLLKSMLRVKVVDTRAPVDDELPDILGHHQLLEDRIRFTPRFPFESGVRYCASFDPQPLSRPELTEVQTLDFSLPTQTPVAATEVAHIFPSARLLPENLLRFYVSFSNSMQRGRVEQQIRVFGPDGRPAPDVLYRPPVELWDRSMRHLTILLDPGRLKRGVGPNRELGPPLKPNHEYTLAIGSGMLDLFGHPLRKSVFKTFRVTEAVREPIVAARWKVLLPETGSRQPLRLAFPRPLDWALLWHAIKIASSDGQPIEGRIAIDQDERRWSFTPERHWVAGAYRVGIASGLEDVCGNDLLAPFDSPLRSGSNLGFDVADRSIPFHLGA